MARLSMEECAELAAPGEMKLTLEVHRDGTATALCPCCGGCGEHDSHSGNDPDNRAYPCRACGGTGSLDSLPELRAEPRSRALPWRGWTAPRGTLSVRRAPGEEGLWRIAGGPAGTSVEADAGDLVMMARAVIRNMENGADESGEEGETWGKWEEPQRGPGAAEAA